MLSDEDPINPPDMVISALFYEITSLFMLYTRVTNKALSDNVYGLLEYCVQVEGDVDKVNFCFM